MKKKYVAPESKLIALNITESIAASGGMSEIGGMAVIKFHSGQDGCRELYTNRLAVSDHLKGGANFIDYYNDFQMLVQQTGMFEASFYCFGWTQNL